MNIEKRIRAIAAKKVKVVITGKTRNREGFEVIGPSGPDKLCRTKKEALQNLLARLRCADPVAWMITPVKITPNPKHKATLSTWGKKMLP